MSDVEPVPRVRVGVGVIVMSQDGLILVGKRKGSHGAGTWAVPGGHLEFGESFEECAAREVLEETGLRLTRLHFAWASNCVFDEKTHYVTIFVRASLDGEDQSAELLEPEKCECWVWSDYRDIPEPRFQPLQALLDSAYDPSIDMASLAVQLGDPVSFERTPS